MKKGWETKCVGDILRLEYGKPLKKTDRKSSGRYPVYGANGEKDRTDKFYHGKSSIIVGRKGSAGEVNLTEKKFWPLDVAYFVTFDKNQYDLRFLYYLLTTLELTRLAKGVKPGINRNEVYSQTASVPPLSEQHRIVGVLDEAFAGLAVAQANAEKNLKNARDIFKSQLNEVFTKRREGWVEKTVSEIADHSLGKMLDKAKNKGEPKPYLRNLNVRWFSFDLSDVLEMRFLPEEKTRYTAVKGDVLVCEGGYPGRAAIWENDEPVYFQKALHRVRFREPNINRWFVYFLYAQDQSGELKKHFNGAGIQHFTGQGLAKFEVPLPPRSEMLKAVSKFDALSAETHRLAELYERKRAALGELKKSLLHQAFAGEL